MAGKAGQNQPEEMLLRVFRLAEILLDGQSETSGTLMANHHHNPTTPSEVSQTHAQKTRTKHSDVN